LKYTKSDILKSQTAFHSLTPDRVINLVEKGLGNSLTNFYRPLISYINGFTNCRPRTRRRSLLPGEYPVAEVEGWILGIM
jgi:hypothetical protein